MPVFNNILAGAAGSGGAADFKIERSLRFNSADSAYLNRTPSSASNRRTWTLSFWVKKHRNSGNAQQIFGQYRSNSPEAQNRFQLYFLGTNELEIHTYSLTHLKTNRVFRDNSAWYHIVLAVDTTLSTADNRMRLYVNGVEETSFATRNNPSQNLELGVNTDGEINIGTAPNAKSSFYADINLAEVHFIDGQQLAATDFGEFDADTGVWNPKAFSGTYGTNGFHLNFSDNSSKAALGTDSSGNSNTWTVNNLAATAPGLSTANQGFDVLTYTGNGSSQTVSGLAFQPDFVWYKNRASNSHKLFDSIRGATKVIYSNYDGAEQTITSSLSAFTSSGFTVGSDAGSNTSGNNYVAWCWKAGGTAVSNTYGSITSSVSANNTYGFSIVTYTGDGNNSKTVGHGLNSAPKMVFYKRRDASGNWKVYHESTGAGSLGELNSAGTISTNGDIGTAPTSSVIAVSSGVSTYLNDNNGTYVAYCWSEIPGFSKFGSFTHSSTTSLNLGFKPKFFLIKQTDGTTPWYLFDAKRDSFDDPLFPNTAGAEANGFVFTANDTGISWISGSLNSGTYIYAAFADKPNGSIIDSLIDTPTNYEASSGNNGGNYATLNPLDTGGTGTLSNGNLDALASTSGSSFNIRATIAPTSGKYYWEYNILKEYGIYGGIALLSFGLGTGSAINANGGVAMGGGALFNGGSQVSSSPTQAVTGDVMGFAWDVDNSSLQFYLNGVSQGTVSSIASGHYAPAVTCTPHSGGGGNIAVNFGQRGSFAYTPPTGYVSLCTQNLDDPLIADGSTAFDVVTRPGGGVTKTFTTLRPGFVWEKRRDSQSSHYLFDVNRGNDKYLITNNTTAEGSSSGAFTFNTNSYAASTAFDWPSSATVVDWVWDGGDLATNSAYNQSQTWSNSLTSSGSFGNTGGAPTAFDGSTSTLCQSNANSETLTFAPSGGIAYSTSVEVYTYASHGQFTTTSDGAQTVSWTSTYQGWKTIASGGGTFTSTVLNSTSTSTNTSRPTIAAIRVDGKILVDAGVIPVGSLNSSAYDQSQRWRNYLTSSSGYTTGYGPAKAFNGVFDGDGGAASDVANATFTFTPPAMTVTSLEVNCYSNVTITLPDGTTRSVTGSSTIDNNRTVDIGSGFSFTGSNSIVFTPNSGALIYLERIKINGKELVDDDVTPPNVPTVASTVRANPTAGFSIVSYTGTQTSAGNGTIGHGLNAQPALVISKDRDNATPWIVQNTSLGSNEYLILNDTAAVSNSSSAGAGSLSKPTSSVFYGSWLSGLNTNGADFIAYCFAPVEGYSAFGSYTGNGSADGPFVFTGMRPKWLLLKRTDSTKSWQIIDTERSAHNVTDDRLFPDDSGAESSSSNFNLDILSNGFKCRTAHDSTNVSGGTYIYAAFAENPFKTARAR